MSINMKRLMAVILLALPLCTFAAEKVVRVPDATGQVMIGTYDSYYKAGVTFDVFGSARSDDLNKYRGGVGIGANLYFANNLGVGVEALTENTAHSFVDTVQGNALWRITSGRAALNLLGGVGNNFETEEWFIAIGGGPEYAFSKVFHVFADARAVKPIEGSDIHALFRAGIRLSF